MNHMTFCGTHYEIGYRWGSMLQKNGKLLLETVPFPLTGERRAFSTACLPFYEQFYPAVLQELHGIADGQNCNFEDLCCVLFSMYCILPQADTHCSCFVAQNQNGGLLLGRNSDFFTAMEDLYINARYQLDAPAYRFTGNTTAFVEMEDGINQHGLAVGLTSVAPDTLGPGLNVGMLLRLCLEQCRTTKQVEHLLRTVPHAGSGTLVAADSTGSGALFEFNSTALAVQYLDNTHAAVYATNMFHTATMCPHNRLPQDTWQAQERYDTLKKYFTAHDGALTAAAAKALLAGKEGFLCQYDRATGKDTVWSVLYAPQQKQIWRAEGNPARLPFEKDLSFML
ncbi:MAG: hypothetical protein PWQ08_697 [Clostridiales bacterium]|nr:hypothetical protein [Clostridiales bacterium]